ncbi:MAG: AAA family ATPase [Thioploca sp.]|nr:AAA family ATPase [Thioploca sp.]
MEIKIENLGPIASGKLDLSKDLIVFTGPNNSGKSYLAYLIYGLYKIGELHERYEVATKFESALQIEDTDLSVFDLRKAILNNYQLFFKLINETITPRLMLEIFSSRKIIPSVKITQPSQINFSQDGVARIEFKNEEAWSVSKQGNLKLIQKGLSFAERQAFIKSQLSYYLFKLLLPSAIYFFPAERTAINFLAKEIFRERSVKLDKLSHSLILSKPKSILEILDKENIEKYLVPRYPLAIHDYLYFVNDLANLSKNESEFANFADEIENLLLQGQIAISGYGNIEFIPQNSQQTLELPISSSLIKSLSSLVFYFRHMAQPNDIIMIDEPELNLHPNNQRMVARIFAKAVNKGFKVILSTHSDYIIKELNNLIMLNKSAITDLATISADYGYEIDSILDKNKVGAYWFGNNTIEPIEVADTGFSVKTIDATIDQLDNTTENLYYQLFETA